MSYFEHILKRIGIFAAIIGAGTFLVVMFLITLNVITRLFKMPIPGVYELTEVVLMAGGAYTLAYATLYEANVEITMLTRHLPKLIQTILQIFTSFFSMVLWTLICWQSIGLALQRGISEHTEVLKAIFLPSRIFWIIGLLFLILLCFKNTVNAVKGERLHDTH